MTLKTGDASDTVHISQRPDGQLTVKVNDRVYTFNGNPPSANSSPANHPSPPFTLRIETGGGNDNITLDPNVTVPVEIKGGDGDDTIRLGSGYSYVEGNDGNDTIIGGSGALVAYGNKGNDRLYAGAGPATKSSHLDGGEGNDELYAGNGHTVINGGPGDDKMVAHDDTTFYTGEGSDTVWANNSKARIYAKAGDRLLGAQQSTITTMAPSDAGSKAFDIQGSEDFKQRVKDDIALLRASPVGRKMLEELDKAAERNGGPITIRPSESGRNAYFFDRDDLEKMKRKEPPEIPLDDPRRGALKDGEPGARTNKGLILYDPASIHKENDTTSPIVQFYHEMAHAWNGANGTFQTGPSDPTPDAPDEPGPPNAELQAVGLPTSGKPFDFDNDSSTPPTSTNPAPFNENALRAELGRPLRKQYY